jgi:glycosyltransferase involved in cell wall biosynthesis
MTTASTMLCDEVSPILSVVVPCYNESINLPLLYDRLCAVLDKLGIDWEMIAVDDHSRDETFEILTDLADRDRRVCAIRLARNVGSHISVMCGLEHSRGSAAVMMSADLQDPPEVILRLYEKWRDGEQVVWAVRDTFEGRTIAQSTFSRLYHTMMARILGNDQLTPDGADFFLIDRIVVNALTQHQEANLSLFGILAWLGFRQGNVFYTKEERKHGRSGWTLKKKLKLFIDSVTAFSYLPIRIMSAIGIGVALSGCIYASVIILHYIFGAPPEGWTSVIVVVLVLGGTQIAMLGVLGEYLWRSLDESRRRPRYNVERIAGVVTKLSERDHRIAQSNRFQRPESSALASSE